MSPERWREIDKLFQAALARDVAERAAFLAEACAGDEALRREVESLLMAREQAGDFILSPAIEVAADLMAEEQADPVTGQTIGPYQILRRLGAGGMGEVYLAEDARLGRQVALKLLPARFMQDRERVWRFEREARAASALNHPNILTIYEIGEVSGIHFIATEYIEGQTLRQRMQSSPVKPREALDVAIQIASALAAAHEAGVVHRDIKPENVMVRRDRLVKVLDFGLAKLIEKRPAVRTTVGDSEVSAGEEMDTTPGTVIGTVSYMSPEQVRGEEVDARTDIFSLGVALYEMLAGRAPFAAATTNETIAAILDQEAQPLMRYALEIPSELERIVSKALVKDREERYQVVKDLLIDLKSLKLELEVEAKLKRAVPADVKKESKGESPVAESPIVSILSPLSPPPASQEMLEPVGGAVPLESKFYIKRPADEKFHAAIARRDSIVLVKGARQVGKTSLLARGLQQAREAGARVVLTDFQNLSASSLESVERLLLAFGDLFADQLNLDVSPNQVWKPGRSPSINFEEYLRREAFARVSSQIVWGLDEVDQLFTCGFGSEIFGLFRSWHNKRALDPAGPWRWLTLAIAYATEAHLFITNLNQSPFNVGTRLALEDFTFEQVAELNQRYGSPLRDIAEIARYFRLVGGHPYLVRCGLFEMATNRLPLSSLESRADRDEGPFGDHLRRILVSLSQDAALCEVVRGVLQGHPCSKAESFYRLRSAGLMAGDSERDVRPRCQLYATYLERHLL